MVKKQAGLLLRVVSKSIDFILVFAAAEALPKAGWLAGLTYLLISDGLFGGGSIGKKLTGLRVETAGGKACSIKDSILRNATFGIGIVLWRIPFIGWFLLAAVVALEFIILVGSKEGVRMGDDLAKTSVYEMTAEAGQEN